jgi:hypothetical protein
MFPQLLLTFFFGGGASGPANVEYHCWGGRRHSRVSFAYGLLSHLIWSYLILSRFATTIQSWLHTYLCKLVPYLSRKKKKPQPSRLRRPQRQTL